MTQLLAIDVGDVRERLAAVCHAADGTGLLGGRAVEAGRAQQVRIGVADVETIEGLPAPMRAGRWLGRCIADCNGFVI